MKLQDKLQEIQNEVCLRITGVYWSQLLVVFVDGKIKPKQIREIQKEISLAFAAYCCDRQRESDAEAATTRTVRSHSEYLKPQTVIVSKSSILNNKLITDDYDN